MARNKVKFVYARTLQIRQVTVYSQLSPCGHFAITDTPIIRTAAKFPVEINYKRLTEINACYFGLSLQSTLFIADTLGTAS